MPRQETVLQVFVASPSDVEDERSILEEVIKELNITLSPNFSVRLDLIRWETHVHPDFGDDAQQVINEQIPEDYDIFIGIMWSRFGTPTGRAGSGTEEEFNRALEQHNKDKNSIDILWYFKDSPISPSKINTKQLNLINKFKKKIEQEGGLYSKFEKEDDFTRSLRLNLTQVVHEWRVKSERIGDFAESPEEGSPPDEELKTVAEPKEIDVEEEELGILDYMEQFEDSFDRLTEIVTNIGSDMMKLNSKLKNRIKEMEEIKKINNRADARKVKNISNNTAKDMNMFFSNLPNNINLYSDCFNSGVDSFQEILLLSNEFDSPSAGETEEVYQSILQMQIMIKEAKAGFEEMLEQLVMLPPLTREFNKAKKVAKKALDQAIDEYEKSVNLADEMIGSIRRLQP